MTQYTVSGSIISSGLTISSADTLDVFGGGHIVGATVNSGTVIVGAGGTATGTTLNGGWDLVSGGVSIQATLSSAAEYVEADGYAVGTVIGSGSDQWVVGGGRTSAATIASGGQQIVTNGSAIGDVISSGGQVFLNSAGVASQAILQGGSVIIAGGTLELAGQVGGTSLAGVVTFCGSGVLDLLAAQTPFITISGFSAAGDSIDITGVGAPSADATCIVNAGGMATLLGVAGTVTLTLEGVASGSVLEVTPDGAGGMEVVLAPQEPAILSLQDDAGASSISNGCVYSVDGTCTIQGVGTPGATVTLYDGNQVIGSASVWDDGTWNVQPSTPLAPGMHVLSAMQVVGGISISSSSSLVTVGIAETSSRPTAIALASTSDSGAQGDGVTNDSTPLIVGTGIPGATLTIWNGSIQVGTSVVAPDGTWSVQVATSLPDGSYSFAAVQTEVGMLPSATLSAYVVIDTVRPLMTVSETNGIGIGGAAEAGSTVSFTGVPSSASMVAVPQNGQWVLPVARLSPGSYSVGITDTDAAGNATSLTSAMMLQIAYDGSYVVTDPNGDAGSRTYSFSATNQLEAVSKTNDGAISVDVVGADFDMRASAGTLSYTLIGINDVLVGNATALQVSDAGKNDHVDCSSGNATVFANGSGLQITGGGGAILFVDSTGGNAVDGGQSAVVAFGSKVGSSYSTGEGYFFLVSGGGNDTVSAEQGSVAPLVFGASGADVTIDSSTAGTFCVAGTGDETIDARGSSAGTVMFAGTGNDVMVGGSAADFFAVGQGDATLTGGAGSVFAIHNGSAGGTDIIMDFSSYDSIYLLGYGQSASNAIVGVNVTDENLELLLSDGTHISFSGYTDEAAVLAHLTLG